MSPFPTPFGPMFTIPTKLLAALANPATQAALVQANSLIWLLENGAASLHIGRVNPHAPSNTVLLFPTAALSCTVVFADQTSVSGYGDDLMAALTDLLSKARQRGPLAVSNG